MFLVTIIDTPGHAELSWEVTAGLRVSDGALVVIEGIEGVCQHTETVLRQALVERVKPIIIINKLDYALFERKISKGDLFQSFKRSIQDTNIIIALHNETVGCWCSRF